MCLGVSGEAQDADLLPVSGQSQRNVFLFFVLKCNYLDKRRCRDVIYLNFCNIFDMTMHGILLFKWERMTIIKMFWKTYRKMSKSETI